MFKFDFDHIKSNYQSNQQTFKIKINRDERVQKHMTTQAKDQLNLLFYKFNNDQETVSSRDSVEIPQQNERFSLDHRIRDNSFEQPKPSINTSRAETRQGGQKRQRI